MMGESAQNQVDIVCDVCGSQTRVAGFGQQFGTLQALWGYGSLHDGERYRVHLCEACFFGVLVYLRKERRTYTLSSDESPSDDQEFGRVARDDFFGDS